MEAWNQIINTALLGTDKRQPDARQWPARLSQAAETVAAAGGDKEELFLQTAALVANFRQCGMIPLHKEVFDFAAAGPEEKPYCNAFATQVLTGIIETESASLLRLWLQQCAAKDMIVVPDMAPLLLDIAVREKKQRSLLLSCCGKRGEWLCRFNSNWNFSANDTGEQLWETGTPEQRETALLQLRETNPALAREWLQKTWNQEDANTKASLLQWLSVSISEEDSAFLESLLTEKSKKVKDAALKLLKQIPSSSIVRQYQQVLERTVTLKKEKSFFGIGKQAGLHIELPADIDENIFKTGIEKLSSDKNVSDDEHIIMQLAASVPLSFWETQLASSPENIIHLFQKDKTGKKLLPALIRSLVQFKDQRWAIAFMQHSETFYIDIIPFLPARQQEHYSIKFMGKYPDDIISYAIQRQDEWSPEFARTVLKHASSGGYRYNRDFWNQQIHLLPVSMIAELEKYSPPEEYLKNIWVNTSEHIKKLASLKSQTFKAFNE
jgi:hypothetical protein